MICFDTNVLVYMTINQSDKKQELSRASIRSAIENKAFFISPMILSEYIYILAKLKIVKEQEEKIDMFAKFVEGAIDKQIVADAYALCKTLTFCKNINDVIHLKIAEKYCHTFITFDSDFKKLQPYTNIEIEILK